MDAKDQLRRYLEQRRDAGESELVLDSLSVEDVMRLMGATGRSVDTPVARHIARDVAPPAPPKGEPDAEAPRPTPRANAETVGDREAEPAPGDWRAALRAAGVAPSGGSAQDRSVADKPSPPIAPEQGKDPMPKSTSVTKMALDDIPTGYVVGTSSTDLFGGAEAAFKTLKDLEKAVAKCTKCPLYKTAKNPVPGEGDPHAGLMCVGEAPGATEDEQGRPFVGQAGQLLTKILAAIDLSREDVFIANVLKHRPPGNRNPQPMEVEACSPYLIRQIELIRPKVLIAFGTFAAQTLLNTKDPIGKLRGKIHRYYGVPLIVTYHPAALLRNPSWKRPTWEDVQLARRLLDRARRA